MRSVPEPDHTVAMAVFEEARRLLVRQETDLDTMRARALTLVSAGAVVAGLFASGLPEHRSDLETAAVVTAVLAFAASVGGALRILWPTTFAFSHRLDRWIDDLRHARPVKPTEWAYNLSRDFSASRVANQQKIDARYRWLSAICVLLGLQVMAWLLAVA